jgi:hypothetical protein
LLVAAVRLPTLYPGEYARAGFKLSGFWLWFCPGVGVLMVIFSSVVIVGDLHSLPKVLLFLLFIVSGVLYYQRRKAHLFARGIDIARLEHETDWTE